MVYEMGFIDFLGNSRVNVGRPSCFVASRHVMHAESSAILTDKVLNHIMVRKFKG